MPPDPKTEKPQPVAPEMPPADGKVPEDAVPAPADDPEVAALADRVHANA